MDFFRKTLGGLNTSYYIRQLVFGGVISALMIWFIKSNHGINIPTTIVFVVNGFLYPYSRFAYESIVSFIIGDNVFYVKTVLALSVKFFTMLICWVFAFCIAPVGLICLYFLNSKRRPADPE